MSRAIPRFGDWGELRIVATLVLLACLPFVQGMKSRRCWLAQWSQNVASAGLLVVVVIGTLGCGGGGGGSAPQQTTTPTSNPTPAGVYTIIVTPTATSASTSKQFQLNPVQLTLTVK